MAKRKWKGSRKKVLMISARFTAEEAEIISRNHHRWAKTATHWDRSRSAFIRARLLPED